jgi:16S rRNA (guanine1207-N2)-methyltransferase
MDPVDELIMAEATEVARGAAADPAVVVLDAPELAGPALELGRRVVVHCDSLVAERTVPDQEVVETDPATALAAADLVLLRLPKALAALDEWCELIRAHARPGVRLVAGARVKHLRYEMNEVLARHFGEVHASLGVRKARVLHAAGLIAPGEPTTYPRRSAHGLDLPDGERAVELVDHGSAFAHARIDAGTRLLISTCAAWPRAGDVIDLACGDGVLALTAALTQPEATVLALDDSVAACRSASATAAANGVRVQVLRADGLTASPDDSADLIVCNPPFHQGTTKDSTSAMAMLADTGRVLRPDGELWAVFNAHLPYLPLLRDQVGRTSIAARNRSYVVTRTVVSR